jgi:hypothetical protein
MKGSDLMRPILRGFLSLFLFGLLLAGIPAYAQSQQRCFSETGYCISDRIRDYWEGNGGLAVFGYPISPLRIEKNPDDGQLYSTQWFERNRFEWHWESRAPYDIQLGRLGDDLLETRGEHWQSVAPGEPTPGCLWFAETRHSVCDQAPGLGFKSYWEHHGLADPALSSYAQSLALFGLPLTEARLETNPTDGQQYLTQWFERARFEWHPQEPDSYKVLLGLLGSEVHEATGVRYMWPTILPQQLIIKQSGSYAHAGGFTLTLTSPTGGQFSATLRGGVEAQIPPQHGTRIIIHGQPGIAFTTGAGYNLFWSERGWSYQLTSGLSLDDALLLAQSLEPLNMSMWHERMIWKV